MSMFIERFLNSPIIDVPMEYLRREMASRKNEHFETKYPVDLDSPKISHLAKEASQVLDKAIAFFGPQAAEAKFLQPDEYPYLLENIPEAEGTTQRDLSRAYETARPIATAHAQFLAATTDLREVPAVLPAPSDEVLSLSKKHDFLDLHVARLVVNRQEGGRGALISRHDSGSSIMTPSMCLMTVKSDKRIMRWMSFHQYLMIKDTLLNRRNALIAASIAYEEDDTLPVLIKSSWEWQEECLKRYGNRGYEVAKSTEALSKAYMTEMVGDVLAGEGGSYDKMISKIDQKETNIAKDLGIDLSGKTLLSVLYDQSVMRKCTHPQQVVELFGVQKLCGHPTIDLYLSGTSLQKVACAPDTTLPQDAYKHRAIFRRMFVTEFIRRNKRWPRMSFIRSGTALEALRDRGVLNLHRHSAPLEDYLEIKFRKEFDLNPFQSYLELLDDKALSFKRSEKHMQWDGGQETSERRLLLEILMRGHFSMDEVIAMVENDEVPWEMMIESLYPKELEFKPESREFGMNVGDIREFFAMEEANIAEFVIPYFPQITMTDSKLSIHRRFLELTRPLPNQDMIRLLLELDLTAWNSRWRYLCVGGIGADLNDLFGVKRIFTYVHNHFERSAIMIRVPGARPRDIHHREPPVSSLYWTGHKGGVEGRTQKLWSIATAVMIEMALVDTGYMYSITDQGDNIIPTVVAPRLHAMDEREQLQQLEEDVLSRCEKACRSVNQLLKPEECLASTRVLSYSKVFYLNGIDYPTTIKALIKLRPSSATDFPSFSAEVRSVFAGAYAAAETSRRPERCYWMALLMAALYMIGSEVRPSMFSSALKMTRLVKSPSALRFALVCPSELGGFPILGPYSFMYRGGGDPTSKAIAGLKMLQARLPEARRCIFLLTSRAIFTDSPNFERLVSDPFSFPIKKPSTPEDSAADATYECVRNITRNRDFIRLFEFADEQYKTDLLSIIKTLKPMIPTVARDLYDVSALGTIDTCKRMFLKTKTLQQVSRRSPEDDIVGSIITAAKNEIFHLDHLIRITNGKEDYIGSIYNAVESGRSEWNKCGIRVEGLTSYLPIDFDVYINPPRNLVGVSFELQGGDTDLFYNRGPMAPYLGSTTASKQTQSHYKVVGTGPASSALRSLQSIWSWSDYGPNMREFVDYLSRSRAGINLSEYQSVLPRVLGGDLSHRYEARVGDRGAYIVGYTTFSSHGILDSNNAGFLSASVDDYKVMFQEFYLYLISLCGFRWDHLRKESFFRAVIRLGDTDLDQLNMPPLEIGVPTILKEIPRGLPFVQTDRVLLARVGGALDDPPFKYFHPDEANTERSAVVAEVYQSLRRKNTDSSVVTGITITSSLAFGVQELVGMGLTLFIDLSCVAVIDSASSILPSPALRTLFKTSVGELVMSYSSFITDTVLKYSDHPLLRDDPIVIKFNLGPILKYGGFLNGARRLKGFIASRMERMVENPNSLYYTTPVVIFSSDQGEVTYNAYKRLLRRKMMQGVARGEIDHKHASFVVGSTIKRTQEDEPLTEDEELQFFKEYLDTYNFHRMGLESVSKMAVDYAERVVHSVAGYQVGVCSLSSSEIIRRYRYKQAPQRPKEVEFLSVVGPRVDSFPLLSQGKSLPLRETRRDRDNFSLGRSIGETRGYGLSAYSTWWSIRKIFEGRKVLVVGSGLGGCAGAAAQGGASQVTGHDLKRDFPQGVPLGSYVPPLVRAVKAGDKYTQTDLTLTSSGDWLEPGIASRLLLTSGGFDLVVVDLDSDQGSTVGIVEINHLSARGESFALRCQTSLYNHERILGGIVHHSELHASWNIFSDGRLAERVYLYTPKDMPWSRLSVPLCGSYDSRPSLDGLIDSCGLILSFLVAPLGISPTGPVKDVLEAAIRRIRSMTESSVKAFSYSEWSEILQVGVSCDLLLSENPQSFDDFLDNMETKGFIEPSRLPGVRAIMSKELISFVVNRAARLLGHLYDIV
jgi:hypothetical protein